MAELTEEEWSKIYAKAWSDPEFRKLLETDPIKAVEAYGKEVGKTFSKIVPLHPEPSLRSRHGRRVLTSPIANSSTSVDDWSDAFSKK